MSGYQCEFCEGRNPVTVLMTWLTNGASVQVCDDDMAVALINIVAVDLGVDPTKFYDHVKRFVDKAAKQAAAEPEKDTTDDGSADGASADGGSTPHDHDDSAERADVIAMRQEAALAAGDDG